MQYLAMRPAHRRKPVGFPQHLGELGIDMAFVVALMRDHLVLNQPVRLGDQRGGALGDGIVERVDDRPQPVETAEQREMIVMQFAARLRGHASAAAAGLPA